MAKQSPKSPKNPDLQYARRSDGIELPVIDVTHPAFALDVSDAHVRTLVDEFMRMPQPFARMPAFLRDALLNVFLRGSLLAGGIRRAGGSHLDAMSTYLMKIGPDNLAAPYASPIDRRIAASLPSFSMRLRLQDIASLLADALRPHLAAPSSDALRMVNIAGGPAADSINALLLLRKEGLLAKRPIAIRVLDIDPEGPAFGMRMLDALRAPGAPLHDIDVQLDHAPYDWNHPSTLAELLGKATNLVVGSSEGGMFEYGNDDAIVANLRELVSLTGEEFVMIGTVTRADAPMQRLLEMRRTAIRPRGLEAFRALASRAGWRITKAIERPFSDHVILAKGQSRRSAER